MSNDPTISELRKAALARIRALHVEREKLLDDPELTNDEWPPLKELAK